MFVSGKSLAGVIRRRGRDFRGEWTFAGKKVLFRLKAKCNNARPDTLSFILRKLEI
jgi:hypothetical protein